MTSFHLPPSWQHAAEKIHQLGGGKILVLGAVDRGKSTFCTFLSQSLLNTGHLPALIDADIGQKDLGPPATVSLGYPSREQAIQALEPEALYFVGAVSPSAHLLPMIVGTRHLVDRARRPYRIINTSGMVEGVGKVLKAYLIDLLRPDMIIALESKRELKPILAAHRHLRILHIPSSPHVRPKSMEHRRQQRRAAFRYYFRYARQRILALDKLIVQRLPVKGRQHWQDLLTVNRLCAVADGHQHVLGLAIILDYDAHTRLIRLSTPVASEKEIKILQLGDLTVELA